MDLAFLRNTILALLSGVPLLLQLAFFSVAAGAWASPLALGGSSVTPNVFASRQAVPRHGESVLRQTWF